MEGIRVANSAHVLIENNTLKGNDTNLIVAKGTCAGALPLDGFECGEGIQFNGATDSRVIENQVANNSGGILLSDEFGPTHGNTIEGNTVENNLSECGITMASHPAGFKGKNPLPGNGVYNNTIEYNVSSGNAAAGVGLFTPTPATKTYNNVVKDNIIVGNGQGGIVFHSHAPGQDLNGNQIIGNWIGLNNTSGDPGGTRGGSGDLATTGIIMRSAVAPIQNTVIKNNTIIGGNHFGFWALKTARPTLKNNFILATVKVYMR